MIFHKTLRLGASAGEPLCRWLLGNHGVTHKRIAALGGGGERHAAQIVPPRLEEATAIDDARLQRAVAYIHDTLGQDLSLAALAKEAAMSPFHFSRAFKRATGKSPLQFVLAERLAHARLLLRTTALPIAEIAHRTGYGDVSRFSKHFKRQFGATPGAIRS